MIALPMTEPTRTETAEDEAKLRAIGEARASVDKDGTISHTEMMAWFRSLGSTNEQVPPEPCE